MSNIYKYGIYMADMLMICGVPDKAVLWHRGDMYILCTEYNDYMAEDTRGQDMLSKINGYDWHPRGIRTSYDPDELLHAMGNFCKPIELSTREVIRSAHKIINSKRISPPLTAFLLMMRQKCLTDSSRGRMDLLSRKNACWET